MDTNQMLAEAQRQDLNRQRQVQAAIAVSNRLLEARESETEDAALIHDLCDERRQLEEQKLELQAKLDAVGLVVKEWPDHARDDLIDVLAGR